MRLKGFCVEVGRDLDPLGCCEWLNKGGSSPILSSNCLFELLFELGTLHFSHGGWLAVPTCNRSAQSITPGQLERLQQDILEVGAALQELHGVLLD